MNTCDFCKARAIYDGKTIHGPWAYMCQAHFDAYGVKVKGMYSVLPISDPDMLTCSDCKKIKPVSAFYKYTDRHGIVRYRTECKECNLLRRKMANMRR